jgi:hypothetical protein
MHRRLQGPQLPHYARALEPISRSDFSAALPAGKPGTAVNFPKMVHRGSSVQSRQLSMLVSTAVGYSRMSWRL